MNNYKSLRVDSNQYYTCEFNNGIIVRTKNNDLLKRLINNELNFSEAAKNPDIVITNLHYVVKDLNKNNLTHCGGCDKFTLSMRKFRAVYLCTVCECDKTIGDIYQAELKLSENKNEN